MVKIINNGRDYAGSHMGGLHIPAGGTAEVAPEVAERLFKDYPGAFAYVVDGAEVKAEAAPAERPRKRGR